MISAFWIPNVSPGGPEWLPGGFRGPLGRQVARWRAKGGVRNQKTYSWSAPGAHLARLGAVLASPPPGEARGGSGSSFFQVLRECRRRRPKSEYLSCFWGFSGAYFNVVFCALLPSLLRARRRRDHGETLKNHWVLWVVRHVRLFRATREESEFQRKRVAKKQANNYF